MEIGISILYVIVGWILGVWIIRALIRMGTRRTPSKFDDEFFAEIDPQIRWLVMIFSLYLAPDPNRASEYTQFILDGSLDVAEANAQWMQEFMARNGLTAEALGLGG